MQFSASYREVIRLSAPFALSLLLPQVSFMANAVFLGQVGNQELVINGLCSIFYLLITYIGFGLSNGILVLLSRKAGQGDTIGMMQIFGNGVFLCLATAFALLLLTYLVAPTIFGLSLHHPEILKGTIQFLNWRVWGLPFLLFSQLLNVYFIAINKTRNLLYAALVANFVNIVLDYLLIFGKAGFPELGLYGAAVASISAELAYLIILLLVFRRYFARLQLAVRKVFRIDFMIIKRSLIVSTPLIIQYLFSIGGWQLFYIYIEHLGVIPLAASHILRSVLGIVGVGTWALASTCNTMVSNLIGQGKPSEVLPMVGKIIRLSFSYCLVFAVVLWLVPEYFLSIYTDDAAVIKVGLKSLRVLSFSILIMSIATICFNAVVGTGRTLINLVIEVFCVLMYIIYISLVVERWQMPLHWAWASEFVYWGCLLLTAGGYLFWSKGRAKQW